MKQVKDLHEFVEKGYLVDLEKFLIYKYRNSFMYGRYEPQELINGFCILILANKTIQKFDPSYGVQFSTYIIRCFMNYLNYNLIDKNKRNPIFSAASLDFKSTDEDYRHDLYDFFVSEDQSPSAEEYTDKELIRRHLKKVVSKKKERKIDMLKVFDYLSNGWTGSEIAIESGTTDANIGSLRKKLIKEIQRFNSNPSM